MKPLKSLIVWVLALESRLILAAHKPFIVAVTGSVGKTSAKDAIYDVLTSPKLCSDQQLCHVRKSEKSLNSDIGLPLTIIGAPNAWHSVFGWIGNILMGVKWAIVKKGYPDCLVLEVGADHPGDIKKVVKWLVPDVAVVTRVSRTPVHVEFFSSPEEVFEEKAALARGVKQGGALVLFADDEKTASLAAAATERQATVSIFGLSEKATVRATEYKAIYEEAADLKAPVGFAFNLLVGGASYPVSVRGCIGLPFVYPLLAAASVGMIRRLSADDIVKALGTYQAPRGRMNLISGINGSILIDDTYNSSPDAVSAALSSLKELGCSGRKAAILGDMMELGRYSADEHRSIGREAAAALGTAGLLITVGPRSRMTADEAVRSGLPRADVRSFDTAEEAALYLRPIVVAGDTILIKGSQSMRMERATKILMREPQREAELLVRQEAEWLEKK